MAESISVLEVFHRLSGREIGLDDTQLLILAVSLSVHFVLNKVYSFTSFSVNLFQDKSHASERSDGGGPGGTPGIYKQKEATEVVSFLVLGRRIELLLRD